MRLVVCTWLATAAGLRADLDAARLERLDRPLQGEVIAMAPDGRHVAYATYGSDRKLWLQIADLEAKVIRSTFLVQDTKPNVRTALVDLRWPSAGRLVFLTNAGLVYGVDADGSKAVLLWEPAHGLSGTTQSLLGETLPLPRMLPPLADDPTHVLLEGPAQSAKAGSSLYRINVITGDTDLMFQDYYRTATRWPPPFSDDPPTFVQERYLYIAGRMLYDRQANPRLQYFIWPGEPDRPFVYSKVGEDPWELDPDDFYQSMPHDTLDTFLGQKKKGEFRITRKNFFEERSFPLAFDYDPNILYFATSMGRDTYAISALNLATKARTEVLANQYFDLSRLEPAHPDGILVFDEFRHQLAGVRYTALKDRTAWRDPGLAAIQAGLDQAFPRQTVEILQWSEDRSRVLARFSSDGDPGRYGLVDTRSGEVENLLNRAPWLEPGDLQVSEGFALDAPGGRLTGYLTLPAAPKVRPAPLIIYCQGGLWDRTRPGFNAESQMLAGLGLVTMRLNFRGTAGFGREHLTSIREGIDVLPTEDLVAAIDWIAARYPVDRNHVVVMGEGFGGYVALRALQTHPETFCAGISINAPTNLNAWARQRPEQGINREYYETDFYSYVREFFVRTAKRKGDAKNEDAVGRPLLVIEDSTSLDATPFSTLLGRLGLGLKGARVERLAITGKFEGGRPDVREKIFARIDTFLNENLYEYTTKVGELKVLDEPAGPMPKAPAKK